MEHTLKILAPAGDEEMLRAAVFSGADCVYLGLRGFNARRSAANFNGEGLAAAVRFCHARNCRVYAAVNTLVFPGREDEARRAVEMAANAGCDAVIAQDLCVAGLVRETRPAMELHASTQMSVHSLAGVLRLAEMGFSRAILSRELTLAEIAAIAEKSPIELEVFVHGALCLSVSGQCYASALLGGRSGNRGGCAGPCRLPFEAGADGVACDAAFAQRETEKHRGVEDVYHLSLKDLSILDALPRLESIGVSCAKIEGRLRGPEYCAIVVDAARKALNGEQYDGEILQNVFSRGGFTDGWFTGKNGGDMFGARTREDSAASRKALPKARELYRRERPRVPVKMRLQLDADGASLAVRDGTHTVTKRLEEPLAPARKDTAPALAAALAKTGGTPFYLEEDAKVETGGLFLASPAVSALRRDALDELLALRESAPPQRKAAWPDMGPGQEVIAIGSGPIAITSVQTKPPLPLPVGGPRLRARFAGLEQMPPNAPEVCRWLLLPLAQAQTVPEALREKTILWLPRVLFGKREQQVAEQIEAARGMGFAGFEANNLAHYRLLEGLPVSAGFGMNITNSRSLGAAVVNGCRWATLSFELTLQQMKGLAQSGGEMRVSTDALCYGHLPLMLTRACPLKQVTGCARCAKKGVMRDRKGESVPLLCEETGVRSLYNPVPLWMADKLDEIPTHTATLYFTGEDRQTAQNVLEAYAGGRPAAGKFTRGLYYRGTEE